MSEDEKIIERLEDTFYTDLGKGIKKFQSITLYEDGIQDVRKLLDLYQKEKEKNKELEEKQNRLAFKTNQYMNDVLSNNIISKDKIRAKIEKLKKLYDESKGLQGDANILYHIGYLKELLEEN